MEEPLIIVTASSILDVANGPVFKYPFEGGKKIASGRMFWKKQKCGDY